MTRQGRLTVALAAALAVPLAFASAAIGAFTPAPGSPFTVGSSPQAVAVADLNGDGRGDLAVVNGGSDDVTILLGSGTGFAPAVGSPVSTEGAAPLMATASPIAIAAGTIDGDSDVDLAVTNSQSSNVAILLNNGSGGFTNATGSPVTVGSGPRSVALGGLDGDADLDLAIANTGGGVSVLLNNGSGTFTGAMGSPFSTGMGGTSPSGVVIRAIDGDADLDLAVSNAGTDNVAVLLNNGAATSFTHAPGSPVLTGGDSPQDVEIGHFDAGATLDLAFAHNVSGNVSILLGDGSGGFALAAGSPFGSGGTQPDRVAAGNLNGDGPVDLAVNNLGSSETSVLLGDGAGGFAPAAESPISHGGTFSSNVTVGSLGGDAIDDIAVPLFLASKVAVLLSPPVPAQLQPQPAAQTPLVKKKKKCKKRAKKGAGAAKKRCKKRK